MGTFLTLIAMLGPLLLFFIITLSLEVGSMSGAILILILIPVVMYLLLGGFVNFINMPPDHGWPHDKPQKSVITKEYERQRIEYNKKRFPEYYKDNDTDK